MIQFVAWLIVSSLLKGSLAGDYGYKRPVTYAGPIVYTDEKPPIINFPGPPSASSVSNYDKGSGAGYGYGESKGNGITYVPLPLDDLPILIYQSKDKPPIHVINRPAKNYNGEGGGGVGGDYGSNSGSGANYAGYESSLYGLPPSSGSAYGSYGNLPSNSYGPVPSSLPPSPSYGSSPAPKPVYVPKPSSPSAVYLPQSKPQYPASGYATSGSPYGVSGNSYAPSSNPYGTSRPSYSTSGTSYGTGSMISYTNAGSSYGSQTGSSSSYSQPPHIIYSGHPPIHVYQQPSVYNQPPSPPTSSYDYGGYSGTSYGTSNYGGGSGYGVSGYIGGGSYGSASNNVYGGAPYASASYVQKPSYAIGYGNKPQASSGSYLAAKPPTAAASKPSSATTYVPAPPGYHKPPIIIYQGVRPPVHVYSEPSSSYEQPTGSYDGSNSYATGGSGIGYSAKNGAQWEPLKPQDGQSNNAIVFSEKIDNNDIGSSGSTGGEQMRVAADVTSDEKQNAKENTEQNQELEMELVSA